MLRQLCTSRTPWAISLALAAAAGCGEEQGGTPGETGGSGGSAGAGGVTTSSGVAGGGGDGGQGTGGQGGDGGAPPINQGFIGGPCTDDGDCPYEGGFCLKEAEGFPGGMCSLDCSQYCPDQDGAVTTFCTEPVSLGTTATAGLCTTRCDYGVSPTGCRPGYQCQLQERYNEPETQVYACTPGEDDPFVLGPCHQELLARGIAFSPAVNPMDSPDGHPELTCDIDTPIWIEGVLSGIPYRPGSLSGEPTAIFTACQHGLAMADAAEVLAALGVTDVVQWGIYNCRVIAGTSTISQHGLANAIDYAGFRTGDGSVFTVLDDWEQDQPNPTTVGGILLRDFVETLYDQYIYNIILTPDYNADHADHFHCDLTEGAHTLH